MEKFNFVKSMIKEYGIEFASEQMSIYIVEGVVDELWEDKRFKNWTEVTFMKLMDESEDENGSDNENRVINIMEERIHRSICNRLNLPKLKQVQFVDMVRDSYLDKFLKESDAITIRDLG